MTARFWRPDNLKKNEASLISERRFENQPTISQGEKDK